MAEKLRSFKCEKHNLTIMNRPYCSCCKIESLGEHVASLTAENAALRSALTRLVGHFDGGPTLYIGTWRGHEGRAPDEELAVVRALLADPSREVRRYLAADVIAQLELHPLDEDGNPDAEAWQMKLDAAVEAYAATLEGQG